MSSKYPPSSQRANPPMGMHRQLLWRDFFYASALATPLYDRMEGDVPDGCH